MFITISNIEIYMYINFWNYCTDFVTFCIDSYIINIIIIMNIFPSYFFFQVRFVLVFRLVQELQKKREYKQMLYI